MTATEHDHDSAVASFGECPYCVAPQPFDGPDLSPADVERLRGQLRRVFDALDDHQWHTLSALSGATGDPEASVSARIRDLRKWRWGAFVIERERLSDGQWQYRLVGKRDSGHQAG